MKKQLTVFMATSELFLLFRSHEVDIFEQRLLPEGQKANYKYELNWKEKHSAIFLNTRYSWHLAALGCRKECGLFCNSFQFVCMNKIMKIETIVLLTQLFGYLQKYQFCNCHKTDTPQILKSPYLQRETCFSDFIRNSPPKAIQATHK